jgi:hypothetical protein
MKKLLLKRLRICSLKEEAAININLNYPKIVIEGVNDTGKSCLAKSIYYSLGADIEFEDTWLSANSKSLATIEVDGKETNILRDGNFFSIYNSNFDHIKTFSGITKGLSDYMAELLDFQLELVPQNRGRSTPTPLFMYLPFYIDQDNGWNPRKMYKSFEGIGQFKSPIKDTLEYFVGVRPKEYYLEKKERDKKKLEKVEVVTKLDIVVRMLEKQREEISDKYVNLDVNEYIKEIDKILPDIEKLKLAEEKYREKVNVLYSRKTQIQHQLQSTLSLKESLAKDYKKSVELGDDLITCPTCDAEYENNYDVRLELANDENKLSYLIEQLEKEKLNLDDSLLNEKKHMRTFTDKKDKLQSVLNTKKAEIKVSDVIKSEGKKTLLKELESERELLEKNKMAVEESLKSISKEMQRLTDKNHIKKIIEKYSLDLSNSLVKLDVPNVNFDKITSVYPKIKKFGSDGPRAVLSMFFSVLNQISNNQSSMLCPIVIDEPNQQGQDKFNLKNVLSYIIDEAPEDAQLILAVEDLHGVEFTGHKIDLTNKNTLLRKSEFNESKSLFEDLISKRKMESKKNFSG